MWCPEGYLRWDEFRQECRKASKVYLAERCGVQVSLSDASIMQNRRSFALANWLVNEALAKAIFSCCSVTGTCLRIATNKFPLFADYRGFKSRAADWDPRHDDGDPPQEWFESYFVPIHIFIESGTGLIKHPSEAAVKEWKDNTHGFWSKANRPFYQEKLEASKTLSLNFNGQALCIKADACKQFIESSFLNDDIDDDGEERAYLNDVSSNGRPRIQEEAAELFHLVFPEGRGGLPWKRAVWIIEEQTGFRASIATFKRALKGLHQNPDQNPDQKAK